MDDILAYTDGTVEGHWKTVRSILGKLEKAGLYLDIDKCDFLCPEVKYLGFIVRAGKSVTVDPNKVKAILEWKPPTSVKGVRSFLGFANFYRCFIDGFSDIAAPLIIPTKKQTSWRWGADENEAFEKMKKIFASEPVLAQWDPERETMIQVDDQGKLRPVVYFSRRLNSAEVNYPILDKEMLALVVCLQEWQAKLRSVVRPFTILSDHRNLSYFATKCLLSERQARYSDVLQQYNFLLRWRAGSACERPNALSRRDQDKPAGIDDERTAGRVMKLLPKVISNPVDVEAAYIDENTQADQATQTMVFEEDVMQALWVQGVATDRDWRRARDSVKAGERGFPPDLAQKLKANIVECTVAADGILRGRENRIWVPDFEPLRTAIMQRTHDSNLAGHP
ncbi:hypothetical protein K3495_g14688, partial [Podosphaera aphanis]